MHPGLWSRQTLGVILLVVLWLPGRLLAAQAPQALVEADAVTTLVVAGTGDSQDLLRLLAQAFMRDNPGIRVDVPDSVGSTAGIRALLSGQAQLARTARPLREDERAAGLTEFLFAKVPVVFAVHPSVTGVAGLTTGQAQALYAGKIKNWSELGGPNLPIARVCRETPETSRELLNAAIPGFEVDGCRGQAVAYTTPDAVALTAEHPGAIGYFSLSAMAGTALIPLAFDGARPIPQEQPGQAAYPLAIPLALVSKAPLAPDVVRFLQFLAAPQAQALLLRQGCFPTPQPRAP